MLLILRLAAALLLLLSAPAAAGADTPAATLNAGAVASPDRYGAEVGREILKAGGNAVDAAVATAFALAVTYPEAGNLGGGGFMTLYVDGEPYFLDYRERAPQAASATMYLDDEGEVINDLSVVGNLAAGTPGTVRGLAEAHKRFGKLTWARVLAPSIRLARKGFVVSPQLIEVRDGSQGAFEGKTNFARYFSGMEAGRTFRQPELAATLQRIAKTGPDEFYKGRTAELLVAQMARGPHAGLISMSDLDAYRAVWRDPIVAQWNGFEVITAPPPSSGGIALLQLLGMKALSPQLFEDVKLNSPQYIHLIAEFEKRVFADRAEYLGDPDFIKVPTSRLLNAKYLARRAREIDPDRPSVTRSLNPGLGTERPQTTHFSVVDRWGNAVSNTYTLNGWYGSGVVVEGAGFLLNDEMDDFSAKPGEPNMYGVVGGDANAIAPFKRPLSSMTPTILIKDGAPAMVLGTPGGSRIFTSVFQVLVNAYDYDLPLYRAVSAMRFHHQLLPKDTIYFEPYAMAPADLGQALVSRGYKIDTQDFNGDIEAIQVIDGAPVVAPDPRARGYGVVVP